MNSDALGNKKRERPAQDPVRLPSSRADPEFETQPPGATTLDQRAATKPDGQRGSSRVPPADPGRWRHGGRTDLANLLPVCSKHHAKIHHDGWTIELGPNRELTLTLPDGQIMTTGPPTIRAA